MGERSHLLGTAPLSGSQLYSRPVAPGEHGPHTPGGAEHVEGLGEAVVVDEASVDGEESHQQDDVAPAEHHGEHLG